jgi:2-polyprenyl-6-methoxyphenol hydroxylase-like FAD-dependent oxidoreductase
LPLRDPHSSSVAWTETAATAEKLRRLDDAAFSAEMQARYGDALGRLAVEGTR